LEAGLKHEPNIWRHEHNHFNGWAVGFKRRGSPHVEYFSDKPGGRAASLLRAKKHRDRLLARLPPMNKLKRTYVRNTTGVVGVARVTEHTRAGTPFVRYVASLPKAAGAPGKASFSVGRYGEEKAEQLAIRARRRGVRDFLHALAERPVTARMRAAVRSEVGYRAG